MLSNREYSGLRHFLQDVEDPVLFSLLETVTKRMSKTTCRKDATEKILSCTGKPSDLLRRQKVTRKLLFKYLINNRIAVSDLDKAALANKCLEFWRSSKISQIRNDHSPATSCKNLQNASCNNIQTVMNIPETVVTTLTLDRGFEVAPEYSDSSAATMGVGIDAGSHYEKSANNGVANSPEHTTYSVRDCDYIDEPNSIRNTDVATRMKVSFTQGFFNKWNTSTDFGPEHFWQNCTLTAKFFSPNNYKEEFRTGAKDVAMYLANLINVDKYHFHANDSEDSIKLESEEHGLVRLLINGDLHQCSNCIGTFCSTFGLAPNPFDPFITYKIQFVLIKLNSSVQGGLPVNNCKNMCRIA